MAGPFAQIDFLMESLKFLEAVIFMKEDIDYQQAAVKYMFSSGLSHVLRYIQKCTGKSILTSVLYFHYRVLRVLPQAVADLCFYEKYTRSLTPQVQLLAFGNLAFCMLFVEKQ